MKYVENYTSWEADGHFATARNSPHFFITIVSKYAASIYLQASTGNMIQR